MSVTLGLSVKLGVEDPRSVRPYTLPGDESRASRPPHSRGHRVHSFQPRPLRRGASSIFSCRARGWAPGLSPQPCDCCLSSSSCLWLLSEQLRSFENATARGWTPSHLPCPQASASPFDIALPGCRTAGTLTNSDPQLPECWNAADIRTPGPSPLFFPDSLSLFHHRFNLMVRQTVLSVDE